MNDGITAGVKPPGRLEIRLLGDVSVHLDGRRLPGFDSIRLQRLLAQLSIEGGVNRGRLAFELWPDSTDAQARGNLRKLLHDLRRALPVADTYLDLGRQSVRWLPDANVSIDVVNFVAAVARGDAQAAAAAYRGDLLPGSYDDWVVAERDRLHGRMLDLLVDLTAGQVAAGDPSAAENARRAIGMDPLREASYRLLIEALAAKGERAEAIRTYHRCVQVLERELGVEPQPSTREAYEAAMLTGTHSAPAPATPLKLQGSPMIGRSSELATAQGVWAESAAGRAHLLVIEGEAGIGKTRLVEELARSVGAAGHLVVRSRSYQAAGQPPWGPVVEWMRSAPLLNGLSRLEPVWRSEVARLLPELRTGAEHAPGPPTDESRHRLLNAVTRGLLSAGRPTLLVLDDLQWCDRQTISVIGYLMQSAPGAPVLIAATVRTEELDEDHPVTALRRDLAREGAVSDISLGRLDAGATRDLASSLSGGALDSGTADRLWRYAEGIPLFVVEAVRTGLSEGDAGGISPTVRAVIAARLAKLSPAARRLVEAAAAVGRSFSVALLSAAAETGKDGLVDTLDELWRRQIVRESSNAYDFSHDRIREVAYGMISPVRRRRLHRLVAEALALKVGADPSLAGLLAAHYEQAGLVREAVDALLGAGRRSVEIFALEDAITAFRRGLALLEQLPAGPERDESELALRTAVGVPLVAAEGYGSDSVIDMYQRALVLCERLGRPVDAPVLRGLGLASLMSCRFDGSDHFGRLLLSGADEDPVSTTEGHYLLGVGAFWKGEIEAASHHLEAAINAFDPHRAPHHLMRFGQDPRAVCGVRLALTELWRGRPDAARRLAEEAASYSARLEHPTTEGYVRMYTAMIAIELEDLDLLERELSAGERVWGARNLGYFARVGTLLRAGHRVLAGERGGPAALEDAVAGWRGESQALHFTFGLAMLARAQLRAGDGGAGQETTREGVRWTREHGQNYLQAEFGRLHGEFLALSGRSAEARPAMEEALEVARTQGSYWPAMSAAASLVRLDPSGRNRDLLKAALGDIEGGANTAPVLRARRLVQD